EFMPGFRVVNSSATVDCNPNSDFVYKIKPDVTVYCNDSDPGVQTDSSLVEIFIKFKLQSGDDPFCPLHNIQHDGRSVKTFLHETKGAVDTLGQITSYAAVQLGAQFHTHVYFVLIVQDKARILRWDRSGTIMTESINFNNEPLLAEFFRRY
ncbi:hypothetical protein DFH94DRAFT_602415, partial [Russula ochroleuca]